MPLPRTEFKSGNWYARVIYKGRKRYFVAASERDAADLAATYYREIRKAKTLGLEWVWPDERLEPDEALTDNDRGPRFVKLFAEFLKTSRIQTHHDMQTTLAARLGRLAVRDIQPQHIRQFISARMDKDKVSGSTVRRNLSTLRRFFDWCVERGHLAVNPVAALPKKDKPPDNQVEWRYLTRDEWVSLREYLPPWLLALSQFALGTGCRLRTACEFKWSGADKQGGRLHLWNHKRDKPYTVAASKTALAALEMCKRGTSPYVFRDANGKPITTKGQRDQISKQFPRYARAAELRDVTFHTLRHTAASWAAQAGASAPQIAAMLDHSSLLVTQRYMHLAPGHTVGVASLIDG